MKQLIYRSTPFGFDRAILAGILMGARRNNRRDGITGALVCRQDLYVQLVEGPEAAIDALYARIVDDDRHIDVRLLLTETVRERLFPHWEMLDDQEPSLLWSPADTVRGEIDAAGRPELLEIFGRLAASATARETPPLH